MRTFSYGAGVTTKSVGYQLPSALIPNDWKYDGTGRAVYFLGGHGGGGSTPLDDLGIPAGHFRALADAGFAVVGVPYPGSGFGGPDISDAASGSWIQTHNLMQPYLKHDPMVDVMGYSMGGDGTLNVIKRQPGKIGRVILWSPLTDIDFYHNTSGYRPGYSQAYAANGSTPGGTVAMGQGYVHEIEAFYRYQVYLAAALVGGSTGVSVAIDTTGLSGFTPNTGSFTVGGLTVTYTGWSGNTFTGCTVSGTSATTVPAGTAFTPPNPLGTTWDQAVAGFRIRDELATWSNYDGLIIHPNDDATVPQGQSVSFVNGVGSRWSIRSLAQQGGHTGQFGSTPYADVRSFLLARQ